jgi:hypothetical protein
VVFEGLAEQLTPCGGGCAAPTVTVAGEPEHATEPLLPEQLMLKLVVCEIVGDVQLPLVPRVPAQPEDPPDAEQEVAPPLEDQFNVGVTVPVPDEGEALKVHAIALVTVKVIEGEV